MIQFQKEEVMNRIRLFTLAGLATFAFTLNVAAADELDRTVLPIPEPIYPAITEFDVRKATAPPRFQVTAPKGAPNGPHRLDRRHGIWPEQRLRRAGADADSRTPGQRRIAL